MLANLENFSRGNIDKLGSQVDSGSDRGQLRPRLHRTVTCDSDYHANNFLSSILLWQKFDYKIIMKNFGYDRSELG